MNSLLAPLRRRVALLGLSLALLLGAFTVRAGDPPTFSQPEVTAFAKEYSKFVDDYAAYMKEYVAASKTNDTARAEAIEKRTAELQTRQQNLQVQALVMQAKVNAEESQKYSDFMDASLRRLMESMQPQ